MSTKIVAGAFIGAVLLGVSGAAIAAPVPVSDTYWGGVPSSGPNTDIIGGPKYAVSGLSYEKVGNDLNVIINTNYANNIGAGGTQMGSLFIGDASKLNLNGSAPNYTADTYTGDTDRFGYVFDFDIANSAVTGGSNGTGSLFALNGSGSDVRLSFGTIFRRNQAVDRKDGAGSDTLVNGTWAVGTGTVTYNITDFFGLAGVPTSLTLAWAMSCANDVVLANASFGQGGNEDVPLPAGVVLLLSGLAGMGALGRRRKAK